MGRARTDWPGSFEVKEVRRGELRKGEGYFDIDTLNTIHISLLTPTATPDRLFFMPAGS